MLIECCCNSEKPCKVKLHLFADKGGTKAELRVTDADGKHTSMYLDANALITLANAAHEAMNNLFPVENSR